MDAWPPPAMALRLVTGLVGLTLVLALERWRPFRGRARGALWNDVRNLALWGSAAALLKLLPFATAVGAGEAARVAGLGLLHRIDAPEPLELLATVVALDAATYAFHRLYHTLHPLWRLHRVHHSDATLTVTSAVRFHPVEVLVSALARVPVVVLLGANTSGIIAFEITLLAASQLQHADVRLPEAFDAFLRNVFVTPNLHRTHHSTRRIQADSNFGTILTFWDRLLGTYRPGIPPEDVVVGLPDSSAPAPSSMTGLLTMPFSVYPASSEASRVDASFGSGRDLRGWGRRLRRGRVSPEIRTE